MFWKKKEQPREFVDMLIGWAEKEPAEWVCDDEYWWYCKDIRTKVWIANEEYALRIISPYGEFTKEYLYKSERAALWKAYLKWQEWPAKRYAEYIHDSFSKVKREKE